MPLELDAWLEKVKKCEHLAEEELKALCDYVGRVSRRWSSQCVAALWPATASLSLRQRRDAAVDNEAGLLASPHTPHLQVKEILIEESNVQPVNAPVTVREVVSADPCAACLRVFGHG